MKRSIWKKDKLENGTSEKVNYKKETSETSEQWESAVLEREHLKRTLSKRANLEKDNSEKHTSETKTIPNRTHLKSHIPEN